MCLTQPEAQEQRIEPGHVVVFMDIGFQKFVHARDSSLARHHVVLKTGIYSRSC
jgi:hypothetical protein